MANIQHNKDFRIYIWKVLLSAHTWKASNKGSLELGAVELEWGALVFRGRRKGCALWHNHSVQESLTRFLPPAGCAPLVSVLNAINFATLFCFTTNFPGSTVCPRRRGNDQLGLQRRSLLLMVTETEGSASNRREGRNTGWWSRPADAGKYVWRNWNLDGWHSLVGMICLDVPEGTRSRLTQGTGKGRLRRQQIQMKHLWIYKGLRNDRRNRDHQRWASNWFTLRLILHLNFCVVEVFFPLMLIRISGIS